MGSPGQGHPWPGGGAPRVDLSISKYADDLVKAVLDGPLPGVDSLIANALESLRCFDEVAATCGYHQNRDKLVGILSLVGKNSRKTSCP